jgi:preprotein translocase subunit SecG
MYQLPRMALEYTKKSRFSRYILEMLLVVIVVITSVVLTRPDDRAYIGGSFSDFQDLAFSTNTRSGKFSPLCGCYTDKAYNQWTGVSFVSDEISVEVRETSEEPIFLVSSTFPSEIYPGSFVPMIVRFTYRDGAKSRPFEFVELTVSGQGALKVAPDPEFPQVSWLPPSRSNTSIYLDEEADQALYLRSHFGLVSDPRWLKESLNFDYAPALDVMGPRISIALSDHQTVDNAIWDASLSHEPALDDILEVSSLEIEVPFSARVSVLQTKGEGTLTGDSRSEEHNMFAGSGSFYIGAAEFLSEEDYDRFRNELPDSLYIARAMKGERAPYESMSFRLPFPAPRVGLHIYGDLFALRFSMSKGDFGFGKEQIGISSPSLLKFSNIEPVPSEGGYIGIPVSFDQKAGGNLDFFAHGEIEINGEKVVKSEPFISRTVMMFATLIATLITVFEFLHRRRTDDKSG